MNFTSPNVSPTPRAGEHGFDPSSPSGTSNFGTDFEPGYNGALIDGARSNNQIGPAEFNLIPSGSFSKRNIKNSNNAVSSYGYTGTSSWHGGDGEIEAGQSFGGWVHFNNNGTLALNNPTACDVFDNTVMNLTDRGDIGASAGTYAFVGTYAPSGHDYRNYMVEYANIDLSGDDPLDSNNDGARDYDVVTGRYNGDWSKLSAARCEDASATNGWHTDPTLVTCQTLGMRKIFRLLTLVRQKPPTTPPVP